MSAFECSRDLWLREIWHNGDSWVCTLHKVYGWVKTDTERFEPLIEFEGDGSAISSSMTLAGAAGFVSVADKTTMVERRFFTKEMAHDAPLPAFDADGMAEIVIV